VIPEWEAAIDSVDGIVKIADKDYRIREFLKTKLGPRQRGKASGPNMSQRLGEEINVLKQLRRGVAVKDIPDFVPSTQEPSESNTKAPKSAVTTAAPKNKPKKRMSGEQDFEDDVEDEEGGDDETRTVRC